MDPLKYPTDKESHAYMRRRQAQNLAACVNNENENRVGRALTELGLKFSRQAIWGFRLYDFWISKYGLAIEVDVPEHDRAYDRYRDEYNFRRSGIVVIRILNNEDCIPDRIKGVIFKIGDWMPRREAFGIKSTRSSLVNLPCNESFLDRYLNGDTTFVPSDLQCQLF
jgi:very-short-patch-repair endonuclease